MGSRDDREPPLDEYPDPLPVFPLPGAVLLPGTQLPLHIFEPRYRAMIADSLASHGYIGMIQPRGGDLRGAPALFSVGCLTRIVASRRTEDGRYYIVLEGISRFGVLAEVPGEEGVLYRQVSPDYRPYLGDQPERSAEGELDRRRLLEALDRFIRRQELEVVDEGIATLTDVELVNALSTGLPFAVEDKQALLEASGVSDRYFLLLALLEMESFEDLDSSSLPH